MQLQHHCVISIKCMAATGSCNAVEDCLEELNCELQVAPGSNGGNLVPPSRNVSNINAISLETTFETGHKNYRCPI
eukprot:6175165-Pleurochrysis_carterae.AAC.1